MKSNNDEQLGKVTKKINITKKAYVTPKITNFGSIEKITSSIGIKTKDGGVGSPSPN